ncbi:hypothetical protein K1719_022961 [Acacia pycnantha]|nr:hypothetical protein K1719_022961 [Acacia pycnantha]
MHPSPNLRTRDLPPCDEAKVENKHHATNICAFYAKGWCVKGSSCSFVHIKDPENKSGQHIEGELVLEMMLRDQGSLISEFTDQQRFKEFVCHNKARMENRLRGGGHGIAASRGDAKLNAAAWNYENMGGLRLFIEPCLCFQNRLRGGGHGIAASRGDAKLNAAAWNYENMGGLRLFIEPCLCFQNRLRGGGHGIDASRGDEKLNAAAWMSENMGGLRLEFGMLL